MIRIAILTPNPAVDVTYRVAQQRIGVTQRVQDVQRMPGGKGLNVARVLAALDVPSLSLLPLGGATGAWIAQRLGALGLDARVVPVAGETRQTVTVVDEATHPTMFGEPGPEVGAAEWAAVGAAVEAAAAEASVLVVSGSLPPGADPQRVGEWVASAARRGVPSIVDVSGPALLAAAAAGASVLKPNLEELLDATGAGTEGAACDALLDLGAGAVVVSRGADGIALHTREASMTLPAVAGVRGNPTGAGDAAVAGLAFALATGLGLAEGLRHATALGAAAVLRPVAGEIDPAAYCRFLDELPEPHQERT